MLTRDQILADVEAHMQRKGLRPTQFGKQALRDPNFVFDLRKGRSIGINTIERVYEFMRENAPPKRSAPGGAGGVAKRRAE